MILWWMEQHWMRKREKWVLYHCLMEWIFLLNLKVIRSDPFASVYNNSGVWVTRTKKFLKKKLFFFNASFQENFYYLAKKSYKWIAPWQISKSNFNSTVIRKRGKMFSHKYLCAFNLIVYSISKRGRTHGDIKMRINSKANVSFQLKLL